MMDDLFRNTDVVTTFDNEIEMVEGEEGIEMN